MNSPAPIAPGPSRSIALAGAFNFRDLGGYGAIDGRTVRWGALFRSDSLGQLTLDDVDALRPLGLRTVIDLRGTGEVDAAGSFPVAKYPVTLHRLSVMDREWDPAAADVGTSSQFLHAQYTTMLEETGSRYADGIRRLARLGALPAVFHCAAGKDRTGLLAMLVLGALGVSDSDIVDDYALTAATMDAFLAARSADPAFADRIAALPANFFAADPSALARVVDDIAGAHGSIRSYVLSLGVTADELASLEAAALTT
jgi:protein-tyrosine phosphatase